MVGCGELPRETRVLSVVEISSRARQGRVGPCQARPQGAFVQRGRRTWIRRANPFTPPVGPAAT